MGRGPGKAAGRPRRGRAAALAVATVAGLGGAMAQPAAAAATFIPAPDVAVGSPPHLGGGGRLQRRRPGRPGRGQLARTPSRCAWATGRGASPPPPTWPSAPHRSRWRWATSTATPRPTWPWPTPARTPSRCAWATGRGASPPPPTWPWAQTRSRWRWATSTATPGPTWPWPTTGSDTVSVRLGDGAGGFTAAPDVAVGSIPKSVAVGDFNGDARADLAVVNSGPEHRLGAPGRRSGGLHRRPRRGRGHDPVLGGGGGLQRRRPGRPGRG